MKIAIIGEKKSVLAFRALGVEAFGVDKIEDLKEAENQINSNNDFAIVFITEDIAQKYQKEIAVFYNKTMPAVLVVPGIKKEGVAQKELNKIMERALGSDQLTIN